nr:glycosyltransferase family 4 protein [Opitutus sp. ER46]
MPSRLTSPRRTRFVSTATTVRKGSLVAIDAWRIAKENGWLGTEAVLEIFGSCDRPTQSKLDREGEKSGVISRGYTREIGEVFQSARYFLLPTFEDGGPRALGEAISAGCIPIVSEFCMAPDILPQALIAAPLTAASIAETIRNVLSIDLVCGRWHDELRPAREQLMEEHFKEELLRMLDGLK